MKMTIELLSNGALSITGPIDDKVLAFGLLEAAKDAVREHVEKKAKERIVLAQPHPLVNYKANGN